MFITQKDIARNLGVSFVTVSRALNNSGYVSKELKKRILDYVKKTSYVPHRASQVLVRNTMRIIAVFSSTKPEYFWDEVERGARIAAEHIRPFNYLVHFHRVPNLDTEKYCSILRKEIRDGLSATAFVNHGSFDMKRIYQIADKAGIPYITYNIDAPETNRLCYIGTDSLAGGRLAANFIGKTLTLKNNGKVLVISPSKKRKREEGFLEEIRKYIPADSCKVVRLIDDPNDPFEEKQIFKILSHYQKKIDAVYFIVPFNNVFHIALRKLDYKNFIVVQHDLDETVIQCLNDDLVTAVVFQDPALQGLMTVRTLEKILENKISEIQKNIEISHTLILRENINYATHSSMALY
jgi:LacI family transcriptional regulator